MKSTRQNQYLGAAGELRVMSELVLRGSNPARTHIDHGVDLILETGIRIQVKTATRFKNKANNSTYYHFCVGGRYSLKNGQRNRKVSVPVDFYIFWCVDDNDFYIIPDSVVKDRIGDTTYFQVDVYPNSPNQRGRYEKYKNKWELIS